MQFDADSLFNRLAKNQRRLASWRQRLKLEAYRLYDRDIPEHPYAIDCYGDAVVFHYFDRRPREDISTEADDERAALEIDGACGVVAAFLKMDRDRIHIKRRYQRSGGDQYERIGTRAVVKIVGEQGLQFKVNLSDYLDTGLFLDHRNLRAIVRREAQDKSVLNLFCYTGAISVYAAAGGASHVTSVDLSNTYINWAKDNFVLNGLDVARHSFEVRDVGEFLRAAHAPHYDVIVMDPPSFSNSKKMSGVFDVQLHHAELLGLCAKRLRPNGVIYFSTNLRSFQPDLVVLEKLFVVREMTPKTLPEDFRNQRIHKSFMLKQLGVVPQKGLPE